MVRIERISCMYWKYLFYTQLRANDKNDVFEVDFTALQKFTSNWMSICIIDRDWLNNFWRKRRSCLYKHRMDDCKMDLRYYWRNKTMSMIWRPIESMLLGWSHCLQRTDNEDLKMLQTTSKLQCFLWDILIVSH